MTMLRLALVTAASVIVLAIAACRHPVLGKPAFVGASATAGFGAATGSSDDELPVDLAVAYSAVITAPHDLPDRYADAMFFNDPPTAARTQVESVRRTSPTLVIGLDWLFWSAYAPIGPDAEQPSESAVSVRAQRVQSALDEIDAVVHAPSAPIVVLGDLPDLTTAPSGGPRQVAALTSEDLGRLNELIRGWAASRPSVVLVDVSSWPLDSTLPDGTPFMQPDGLHPTAAGLVHAMQRICSALQARGLVKECDWRPDAFDQSLLIEASRDSLSQGSAGWLDTAGMYLAYRSLDDALDVEPCDCAAVVRHLTRMLEPAPELESDPTGSGLGLLFAIGATSRAKAACPDAEIPIRRCVDRLGFDVRRGRPNPFRLELWADLSFLIGRDSEVVERLQALVAEIGSHQGPAADTYAGVVSDAADRLRSAGTAGSPGNAVRRAAVVAIWGGPKAVVTFGDRIIDAAETAHPLPDADRLRASDPLTIHSAPTDAATWAADGERAAQARRVIELICDLRAAARSGDTEAAEAAATLTDHLSQRLGAEACQRATDGLSSPHDLAFLPNGGVACRGYVDPSHRSEWGILQISDEPITISLGEQKALNGATPAPPKVSPMQGLLEHAPDVAIGSCGFFGTPDATFTILDAETTVTSLGADGATLSSRPLGPDDRLCQVVHPITPMGLPRSVSPVADLVGLQSIISSEAAAAGCNTVFPFAVRVDGDWASLTVRLERGAATAPGPNDARSTFDLIFGRQVAEAREPMLLEIGPVEATLVGIVAPGSVARIVRAGASMRLHAVWRDADGQRHTAEVASLSGGSALSLAFQMESADVASERVSSNSTPTH